MNIKFDFQLMCDICNMDIQDFKSYATETVETASGIYYYIDNGADILAIAHLDTVAAKNEKNFSVERRLFRERYVYSPNLDNRLGAYVLLHVLSELGLKYDILLTEGEETGNSTAFWFKPKKDYRWMFQFDRRGEDVVMYQYESQKEMRQALRDAGFTIGIGSFSDIVFLEHLGIAGVNIGVGYENEHSRDARANLDVLKRQIKRFVQFYQDNRGRTFAWELSQQQQVKVLTLDDLKGYCVVCDGEIDEDEGYVTLWDGYRACAECGQGFENCAMCGALGYTDEFEDGLCPTCTEYLRKFEED